MNQFGTPALFAIPQTLAREGRRIYRRIPLTLAGHFLDEEFEDHEMICTDISCGGASLSSKRIPKIGEKLILYFDDLGRISGTVLRKKKSGFVVNFKLSSHKKSKIADQLTWLWNRDTLGLSEERTSQRYEAGGLIKVSRADGVEVECRVINISLSGSALIQETKIFEVGEIINIGKIKGEVVRSEDNHFAVKYLL